MSEITPLTPPGAGARPPAPSSGCAPSPGASGAFGIGGHRGRAWVFAVLLSLAWGIAGGAVGGALFGLSIGMAAWTRDSSGAAFGFLFGGALGLVVGFIGGGAFAVVMIAVSAAFRRRPPAQRRRYALTMCALGGIVGATAPLTYLADDFRDAPLLRAAIGVAGFAYGVLVGHRLASWCQRRGPLSPAAAIPEDRSEPEIG